MGIAAINELELLTPPAGTVIDRTVMIVVAHPDDEIIGAGTRLPRLPRGHVVHVTDGAPRGGQDIAAHGLSNWMQYAAMRRLESRAALELAGVSAQRVHELNCPDQRAIFSVNEIIAQLYELIQIIQPDLVLTHPYEGGHPDHDATALAVHAAIRILGEHGREQPIVAEMTSYHLGATGIETGKFLNESGSVYEAVLSPTERGLKQRMLACFNSQRETLQYFDVVSERFRLAPQYDFTQPPHSGMLFYDKFSWGVDSERFSQLADRALRQLDIPIPL